MAFRDPHAILLNRSSILVVTSVGVALLTLSYVLGVQVGKQSAALLRPASKGSGDDLKALPAPILDQLKSFDADQETAPPKSESKKDARTDAKLETKPELKPEAKSNPNPASTQPAGKWTLQLLATPDKAEALRISARAKAAGYPAQVVKDHATYKVRWNHAGAKPDVDAAAVKMKAAGFKPFAVPVE